MRKIKQIYYAQDNAWGIDLFLLEIGALYVWNKEINDWILYNWRAPSKKELKEMGLRLATKEEVFLTLL